jgi:transcriptional regulator with GAF, ATPase, and Fis domain
MLVDIERDHIKRVLASTGGRIEGSAGAARVLGLRPSTLRSLMRRLGVTRSPAAPIRYDD